MVVFMLEWLLCCRYFNFSVTMLLVRHLSLAQIGLLLDPRCRSVSHNLYVTNDCRAVLHSVCSHVSLQNVLGFFFPPLPAVPLLLEDVAVISVQKIICIISPFCALKQTSWSINYSRTFIVRCVEKVDIVLSCLACMRLQHVSTTLDSCLIKCANMLPLEQFSL